MLRFMRTGNKRTKTIWWIVIVVTVVTFVGGFVFILGAGFDSTYRAQASGAVGTVNGMNITRTDYQNALLEQRAAYQAQYGTDPVDRDEKYLEAQTWRSLVVQRLLAGEAKDAGLGATDQEVILAMQVTPPSVLTSAPAFQTDGKFDPAKYRQALSDPNNNWEPFEAMVRNQLPMRKLQERLASAVKLSEPEIREAYRFRFERVRATIVSVLPESGAQPPAPTEAELEAAYEKYGSRFATGPRVQLEVLTVPKEYGEEEVRASMQLAQSLVDRARGGEDFASLARDYSEASNAAQGGVLDQVFSASDFGPQFAPALAAAKAGDILDPIRDGGSVLVVKVVERPERPGQDPGIKVAQILVRIRSTDDQLRDQYQALVKVRKRATRAGLGRAATENGMATLNTGFFRLDQPPQVLAGSPEAVDWAYSSKENDVSPIFEEPEQFVIVQVAGKRPDGIPARDEISEPLRQLVELEKRLDMARPKVDAVAAGLAAGQSLEQAARSAGLEAVVTESMSRIQPDPRFAGSPELIGALFAAPPAQVVGPIRTLSGWYFGRVDQHAPADTTLYAQLRGQISQELLQRRQQSFLTSYANRLRSEAKVEDLRFTQATPTPNF